MDNRLTAFIYTVLCACTARIGFTIHHSIVWAIVDFVFMPFVWVKWLICGDVSISIITKAFEFFLK